MRALLAFDKFKDSLSARQACELAARALRSKHADWQLDLCPLTDGGEGFEEILGRVAGGQRVALQVSAPRGSLVDAGVTLVPLEKIPAAALAMLRLPAATRGTPRLAVVEMAAASGLALLTPIQRDLWLTTSQGTGQLMRAAAELGATAILLGIGGSATHDLGLGALSALGLTFRTSMHEKIRPPYPAYWPKITQIEGEVFPSIPPIRIACDVTNPLLGPQGAAAVYAPQKGLKPERWQELETATQRIAGMLAGHCGQPTTLANVPGTGAAGGISYGLMCAAKAELLPGFDLVSAWLELDRRIAEADMVITGEGRFDQSSLQGKGPGAIAARAAALGKVVHVFAGQVQIPASTSPNFTAHAITPAGMPLADALRQAGDHLITTVQHAL